MDASITIPKSISSLGGKKAMKNYWCVVSICLLESSESKYPSLQLTHSRAYKSTDNMHECQCNCHVLWSINMLNLLPMQFLKQICKPLPRPAVLWMIRLRRMHFPTIRSLSSSLLDSLVTRPAKFWIPLRMNLKLYDQWGRHYFLQIRVLRLVISPAYSFLSLQLSMTHRRVDSWSYSFNHPLHRAF